MKHIIAILAILAIFTFQATAQKVDTRTTIPNSKRIPTTAPKLWESHLWFNTATSDLYKYDRSTKVWGVMQMTPAHAEMSISNDTSTISFAATTPAPIQDLTSGPISGFTMISDSLLRFDGLEAKTFQVSYSGSILFAEAANIIRGYVEVNGSASTRTQFRQTQTLTTENETVGGTALITLNPGALVRFMFVPSAHTGTDILTIYQFNLNLVQVN